jgi:hypothetical protein
VRVNGIASIPASASTRVNSTEFRTDGNTERCCVRLCVAELPEDVRVAHRARPTERIPILALVCSARFELGPIQDLKSTSAMS